MSEGPHREVMVLNAALELPAGQRAAYLDSACAGEPALRRQVEALLQALERAGEFLEAPPAGLGFKRTELVSPPLTEKPGDRIGRYKLLQQIGEGGCGVVYMAEQEEPVRRRVALKVIKLGMDTKQVIARFEAERQALALMDHPNIAKVFDAGSTERPLTRPSGTLSPSGGEGRGEEDAAHPRPADGRGTGGEGFSAGRPYFVMELVRGIKITDFCDEHKVSTHDRLKLFIQVCQAIQHAHQKGVIHRDIKPSNILVTVNDGVPVPKVIDFGIAKATTGQRLTDQTVFTEFQQFIGTPAYMSPEQAVMTSLDIDTRSDIYSLGVLLYELLTGRTPFDQAALLAAGLDEMRRTIREVEPVKPSTRLTRELERAIRPGSARGPRAESGGPPGSRCADLEAPEGDPTDEVFGEPPKTARGPRALPSSRRLLEVKELIHALRGDLDWIVMKALEKDRQRRYETANGLARDVERYLGDESVVARPPSRLDRLRKLVRRNMLACVAAAAVATVLVLGFAGILWQWRRAESNAAEAVAKLREAYLAQAMANRLSGRPGHRFDTLAVISKAVVLHPLPAQRAQLRNQAIAAMSLPDLVPIWTLENSNAAWNGGSIDMPRSRYALVTAAGRVEVRRVPDNALLFELPSRDTPAHLPLDFSPDGKFLAVCDRNSRVSVWDLEQRQVVLEAPGNKLRIETVAFTPDSARVAIAAKTTPIVGVFDLASRRPLYTITNQAAVEYLAFDPTGQQLAFVARASGTVLVVDATAGATIRTLQHPVPVQMPAWHPCYPMLAGGSDMRLWNSDTGEPTGVAVGQSGECGGAAFNHRGDLLVNATWNRLLMWRPAVPLSPGGANPEPVTLAPIFRGMGNGAQLRFDDDDRRLSRIWWGKPQPRLEIDAISCAPEVRTFHSPRAGFEFLRFTLNHDGTFAALALSNAVQLLDVETGIEMARLPLSGVQSPLFLPDQASLVATTDQGLFRWSFQQGTKPGEIRIEPPRPVSSGEGWTRLALGPRGRHLAVWHHNHGHIYSLPDLQQVSRVGDHIGGVMLGPSFSPDEALLVTTRWNSSNIGIWELATSNLLHSIKVNYSRGVTHGRAEFTPDGRWLIVSTLEDLRLYEPRSWTLRVSIPWRGGNQLALLADGKVAAVATSETGVGVHLLTIPDFKELAVLETASNGAIAHLGTSGDGLKLFAVREDGEINIWNLPLIAAGLEVLRLAWDTPLPSPGPLKRITLPSFHVATDGP